jgi:hypothetical protein
MLIEFKWFERDVHRYIIEDFDIACCFYSYRWISVVQDVEQRNTEIPK